MPENITITVDDTTETVALFVSSGTVDSVFGRSGAVVAVAGDYDTSEVTEVTNLYYTDARVAANSAVALNTAKVTFPEAPNDGTQYARKSLGWEAVAGGGDYADGGEAGGADRTLGNTDNFSLGFIVNNLKALLLKPITTAVNWLAISPSTTGNAVTLEAEGTDTNISIDITSKGGGGLVNINGYLNASSTVESALRFQVGTTRLTNGTLFRTTSGGDLDIYTRSSGGAYNNGQVFLDSEGNVGIDDSSPDTKLHVNGAITQNELSADPSNPAEGSFVQWMSDGTGSGDDGDIMVKITAGGVTKTTTLLDFSTL